MTTLTCADCTTPYSTDLQRCPHCFGERYLEDTMAVRRLPPYLRVSCDMQGCPRKGKQEMLRLNSPQFGLVEIPRLYCSACGGQVYIPWPPKEEHMPKISRHKGATNARETAAPSPDALASKPLAGAEAGQGRPLEEPEPGTQAAAVEDAPDPEPTQDYTGMTLAELRALADERGVPSYGTKAQITERLRDADV